MLQTITDWDARVLLYVQQNLRTPALSAFFCTFTHLADAGAVWIALCLILLLIRRTRRQGIACSASLGLEFILCNLILKKAINRIRPYLLYSAVQCIIPYETDASFPSGHTGSSFAVAVMLALVFPGWGWTALIPAALIAVSRIYVGVHYPTDVLAGIAVGTLSALIIHPILVHFKVIPARTHRRTRTAPAAPAAEEAADR